MFSRLVLLAGLCLLSMDALAAWPTLDNAPKVAKSGQQDVALLVGVEDYLLLPDVDGAVTNINEWEVFLRQGLGASAVHVVVNNDATREGILKSARMAAEEATPEGTLWVVFVGHGAPVLDGSGVLVGVDAQQTIESLQARGVRQTELFDALASKAKRTVIVLDACFSGRTNAGDSLAPGLQPVIPIDAVKLPARFIVLSAARADEVAGALSDLDRPAFSYLALGALRGWAASGDDQVTGNELISYSRARLREQKGRQQTPQGFGDLAEPLTTGVDEAEPDREQIVRCSSGETRVDGVCKPVEAKVASGDASEAERTLQYVAKRLTVDDGGYAFVGATEIDSIAFYHEIGRPDLADDFMTHNPYIWVPGIVATAGGIALMAYGLAQESDGWTIGGFVGGFFGMSAGITLTTFGFILDYEPMSDAEKRSAAEVYNRGLRQELDLDSEVNVPRPKRSGGVWPFSGIPVAPAASFRVSF